MSNQKLSPGQELPVRIKNVDEGVYTEDNEQEYQKYLKSLSDLADEIARKIRGDNDNTAP